MATELENLQTVRDQLVARLIEVTATRNPNYSVDGESYSWESYTEMLTRQIDMIEKHMQRAEGPFEVRSYGS